MADRRDADRLERRQLGGLEDAKRVGRFLALVTAAGAGALGAQVLPGVDGMVAVAPVDEQAVVAVFAEGNGPRRLGHGAVSDRKQVSPLDYSQAPVRENRGRE